MSVIAAFFPLYTLSEEKSKYPHAAAGKFFEDMRFSDGKTCIFVRKGV